MVLTAFVVLGCKKEQFSLEREVLVDKQAQGIEKETQLPLVKDDVITFKEIVFSDTSRIALSPGFEQMLIQRRIDPDGKPDGYVLYKNIKTVDTLRINDFLRAGDKSLRGIEGFTNLRYFSTMGTDVTEINFSNNKLLDYFEFMRYPHCMGCDKLESLVFGKNANLKVLNIYNAEELTRLDFVNLAKLRSLMIFGTRKLLDMDISSSIEIETVEAPERLRLGSHPALRKLTATGKYYPVDFTKLPALEQVHYTTDGKSSPNFSLNTELKKLYLGNLLSVNVDVSTCAELEELEVLGSGDWSQTFIDLRNNVSLKKCRLVGGKLSTICVSSLEKINFITWEKDALAQYKVCN